jgi:hypothetical protein
MESLYHNPILTVFLSLLAILVIGNSGLQLYMLNVPPIVVEKEFDHNGAAGCLHWALSVIFVNPTDPPTMGRVLRHEYQHYMQKAILSPLVFNIAYCLEDAMHGYNSNWFEVDAYGAEKDGLEFRVFDWNLKQVLEVKLWSD